MALEIIFFSIWIFIFGLCIGSFLNCVIYRLEQEESLMGRSYCPQCKHVLNWKDLIPVFSFLWLRGRCRYCKKTISWQYPVVELITALLFVILFWWQYPVVATPLGWLQLVFLFAITSFAIVLFVYDLHHFLILDVVLYPAIAVTLVYQIIFHLQLLVFGQLLAALGAFAFFLALFLVTRGRGIGFGDCKLAVFLGLLVGFPGIIITVFLSFAFGAIVGVALLSLGKKGLKSQLPFAPFLLAGSLVTLLWGNQLMAWYLHFFSV